MRNLIARRLVLVFLGWVTSEKCQIVGLVGKHHSGSEARCLGHVAQRLCAKRGDVMTDSEQLRMTALSSCHFYWHRISVRRAYPNLVLFLSD